MIKGLSCFYQIICINVALLYRIKKYLYKKSKRSCYRFCRSYLKPILPLHHCKSRNNYSNAIHLINPTPATVPPKSIFPTSYHKNDKNTSNHAFYKKPIKPKPTTPLSWSWSKRSAQNKATISKATSNWTAWMSEISEQNQIESNRFKLWENCTDLRKWV
jgi:hypothetical protein